MAAFNGGPARLSWIMAADVMRRIRTGTDEDMEIDPDNLRFLFQEASEAEYRGSNYGGIPWRLGLLELVR